MRKFFLSSLAAASLMLTLPSWAIASANDGDWSLKAVTLSQTPEAQLMVRVGDIDNLGYGWPEGFDPFSGQSTPAHAWPCTPNDDSDPAGTDRIMVISSYNGNTPNGYDGYTSCTERPANTVAPVTLNYNLTGIELQAARLQIFVDDFQAPVWQANYQITFNGQRVPELETLVNSLNQTGPIGKLITFNIPANYLSLLQGGTLAIRFDDTSSGAGDGYALDFVKLLINPTDTIGQVGQLSGTVTDSASGQPLPRVAISVNGEYRAVTDTQGRYAVNDVTSGLAVVQAMKTGYTNGVATADVVTQQSVTADVQLQKGTVPTAVGGSCVATLNADASSLMIPCLDYRNVLGTTELFWAELGLTNANPLSFGLKQLGSGYR